MNELLVLLLEKLMYLEDSFSKLYESISNTKDIKDPYLKNTAKVLMREEQRHSTTYKNLITELKNDDLKINTNIIEQAEYNIIMLKRSMNILSLKDSKELITLAIDFENKNIYILEEILLILKEDQENNNEKTIKIFESLLKEEQNHLKNLNMFLK
ncbi:rubrerythrin [Natranaerovirga hydrolytica]|uniref:Rubrerythrin n=1 Tax=Natranaerovirga hydrolytica TaxID=680378 RepID=A0A4R1MMF6_9FIRM|nr:hypothetical protein [Natranaerovirga hydrolytica]TCK92464.1 rubrerythrin [Natranaerovirga hydrolytica]